MKTILIFSGLLFLTVAVSAQQKDISVFEKKEGDKNIVVARNIGKVAYLVTLDIHATGMVVAPGLETETIVPAGHMIDLASLTPKPGEAWSYGYDVSYIEYTGNTTAPGSPAATSSSDVAVANESPATSPTTNPNPAVDDNQIVIYSKPGCSRCAFVRKSLNEKGIKYKEVDVTSGTPEVSDMWMNLRHGGFAGESVTMPVVKVKGQLHYNIKDLQQFVSGIEK